MRMIESDFSDHFVVRRQSDKNARAGAWNDSQIDASHHHPAAAESGSRIGDQAREALSDSLTSDLKRNVSTKKLLTPFIFGKRTFQLDWKKREIGEESSRSFLLENFNKPVPGRLKVASEHLIPGRSSTTLLRPFTGDGKDVDWRLLNEFGNFKEDPSSSNAKDVKLSTNQITRKVSATNLKGTARPHPFCHSSKLPICKGNASSVQSKTFQPQHKQNVYGNGSYTPSSYIPLVPEPLRVREELEIQSGADWVVKKSDNKEEYGVLAGKVENPPEYYEVPPTSTSVPYMRPKTVAEARLPQSSKPSVDSMLKAQNSFQSRIPKLGAPYFSSSDIRPVHGKQFPLRSLRSDAVSPLSPSHIPIRPYIFEDNFEVAGRGDIAMPPQHSIFRTCRQKYPIPLHLLCDHLVNIRKVGEGVYGEVFKAYFRGLPDQRVYKVVPIEGTKLVNGEKQKRFEEIEPEIIVAQELNKLRTGYNGCYTDGHCKLLYARIYQGIYPDVLIDQWKYWHRTYVSQNDLPEFPSCQLYAVFEFEYHGTDIESYRFRNARQSLAVYLHVLHALAAAEAALEFEHRDLHWGNILVVKTREPFTTYSIQGSQFRVPNCGLKSTVIDYTISRLTNPATGEPIFTDLANDEDQFCGSEDYQFEIYRMMRDENQNDWSKFCPKTNIFWAHYLVGKLIDKGRYAETDSPTHQIFRNKLKRIQNNILKYSSCMECVRRYLPPFSRDLDNNLF